MGTELTIHPDASARLSLEQVRRKVQGSGGATRHRGKWGKA
jgi:hypothetical protein